MISFIITAVILILLIPVLVIAFYKVKPTSPSEGKLVYFAIIDRINREDDDEDIKEFLKKRYKLNTYESSLMLSAAKSYQDEYVEEFMNNKFKDK